MKIKQENNKKRIIFPSEAAFVVADLVEKYGLKKIEKEKEKIMIETENTDEKMKIFETFPSRTISRILKESVEEKKEKQIPSLLIERLNISKESSESMFMEIKEKILDQIGKESEKKNQARQDSYRELIEE